MTQQTGVYRRCRAAQMLTGCCVQPQTAGITAKLCLNKLHLKLGLQGVRGVHSFVTRGLPLLFCFFVIEIKPVKLILAYQHPRSSNKD